MKKFCVLGSGSKGNCAFVQYHQTKILIDAGLTAKQIKTRLKTIGVEAHEIDAIFITHDHFDHYQGARAFSNQYDIDVFANRETAWSIIDSDESFESVNWNLIEGNEAVQIGSIQIESFDLPHDAAQPIGFRLSLGGTKLGICTDLGSITNEVHEAMNECELILLDSNYDPKRLEQSDRPEFNKKRIRGNFGHLSNLESARFAVELALYGKLQRVYLGHLSQEHNDPHLAKNAFLWEFRKAKIKGVGIYMTHQKKAFSSMD